MQPDELDNEDDEPEGHNPLQNGESVATWLDAKAGRSGSAQS